MSVLHNFAVQIHYSRESGSLSLVRYTSPTLPTLYIVQVYANFTCPIMKPVKYERRSLARALRELEQIHP